MENLFLTILSIGPTSVPLLFSHFGKNEAELRIRPHIQLLLFFTRFLNEINLIFSKVKAMNAINFKNCQFSYTTFSKNLLHSNFSFIKNSISPLNTRVLTNVSSITEQYFLDKYIKHELL